jgi:hypothetical protein
VQHLRARSEEHFASESTRADHVDVNENSLNSLLWNVIRKHVGSLFIGQAARHEEVIMRIHFLELAVQGTAGSGDSLRRSRGSW